MVHKHTGKTVDENATKQGKVSSVRRSALRDISNRNAGTDGPKPAAKKKVVEAPVVILTDDSPSKEEAEEDAPLSSRHVRPGDADLVESCSKSLPADSKDASDPLNCVDYVNDIYANFRRMESKCCADPSYMSKQQNVNQKMRAILIDWLIEVHLKFKLMPETMFLTVSLIDRFLERKQVARQKLQLVGVTAMLLASKYEEIYFPEVADFVYITDNAYTRDEILRMESVMLNVLQFNLTVPTANRFLNRFLKSTPGDSSTKMLSSYLIERTLQELDMLKYAPSMIAASALYISNDKMGRAPWPAVLEEYSDYKEDDLRDCVDDVLALVNNSTSLKSVKKKYSSSKFSRVAYLMTPEEM